MSYSTDTLRNIALAGHARACKTRRAEALRHGGGTVQPARSIDPGTTVSDLDPIEKDRGHPCLLYTSRGV